MDGFCHRASPKRPSVIGTPDANVNGSRGPEGSWQELQIALKNNAGLA